MSDVVRAIYEALEQLRLTLQNVEISQRIKDQVEQLMTPMFANPVSCQRITDIINDIGDFSENILVPLLEQYVSASVAVRVRFLIEDILLFIEGYRDRIVRNVANQARQNRVQNGETAVVGSATQNRRLAVNSITKKYASAIFGRDQRGKAKPKRNVKPPLVKNFSLKNTAVNSTKRGLAVIKDQEGFRIRGAPSMLDKRFYMSAICMNKEEKTVVEVGGMDVPNVSNSGQILVKVLAVGLTHTDKDRFSEVSAFTNETFPGEAPHVTQMRRLGEQFKAISQSFSTRAPPAETAETVASSEPAPTDNPDNQFADSVLGTEFVGVVQDIAWKKGDLIHRLHVAKDDIVYGVLRPNASTSSGTLSEFVVCNAEDVAKAPRRMQNKTQLLAKLPLDGAIAVRALAQTDITLAARAQVLVIGAGTNLGMILLELLVHDLKIPVNNIHTLSSSDQAAVLDKGGLNSENLRSYNDDPELWLPSFRDRNLDVIYDCRTQEPYAPAKEKIDFETLLRPKLRRNGQFLKIDSAQIMAEKKRSGESWLRELEFLNKLVFERKLSLDKFNNPEPVDFAAEAVSEAIEAVKLGQHFGKLIVEINERNVADMKARVGSN